MTAILPPIWPSAATKAWYYEQLYALLSAAANDIDVYISVAWAEKPPEIGFAQDASSVTNIERALNVWGKKWTARVDKASRKIAASFASRSQQATEYSMRQALKAAGFTVQFRPTQKSIDAYRAVAAENVGLIKSISSKYHSDVRERVWNSVRVGGDLSSLSIQLRKTYGISVRRAALIARDQNVKAKAVIEATRRQEVGITKAIWRHSSAGEVPRPTHVKMSGKVFDIAKGMWDSNEGAWVHPGSLINCRCSSEAILPGLEPERVDTSLAGRIAERQRQESFRRQLGYS
jgi:uncharacterized protein with gpF-like domain